MVAIKILLILFLLYLALGVILYWLPLWAARSFRRRGPKVAGGLPGGSNPFLCVVAPCRDGASAIPGLVQCLQRQDYPADRFRFILLADNCQDPSAALARSLGVDVYERHDLQHIGKGYALNELLERRLRKDLFDVLLLLDIDSRIDDHFLTILAGYFQRGAQGVQGSTLSRNPEETAFTRVGDFIQVLIRLHQRGRSLLGLEPLPMGSHGIALSRQTLDRLDWKISTGRTADDLELALRSCLLGVSMTYAPDVRVSNELPAGADAIRKQRRRWTANSLEVIPKYAWQFLSRGMRGDWKALEAFTSMACLPSFANLFIDLGLMTLLLVPVSLYEPPLRPYGLAAGLLWICDGLYFVVALQAGERKLGWRDGRDFIGYLAIRLAALFESIFFLRSKDWSPTLHKGDEPDEPASTAKPR